MKKTLFLLIGLLLLSGCGVIIYDRIEEEENTEIYDFSFPKQKYNEAYPIKGSTLIDLHDEDVKIAKGGIYILQGKMSDASIIIEIGKSDTVQIVLNGVDIEAGDFAGIYIKQAGEVTITLAEGTVNTISDSSVYTQIDDSNVDALIYSRADLIINGSGSLILNSSHNHGIVSKDDLIVTGGHFTIDTAGQGLNGKDRLMISDGEFRIASGKDALKSDNSEDEGRGYIYISGGTIDIQTEADALYGYNMVKIEDGSFSIRTDADIEDSGKGIKSKDMILIGGGDFNIDSVDDAIHSEKNVTITGGNIRIRTDDDGIHADAIARIDDGQIEIDAAEGIEATIVQINGGSISIDASDDGINAGQKTGKLTPTIEINGGYVKIVMAWGDTDGLDSNGYIYINGGTVDVTGINTFDCEIEQVFNGGTVIINGEEVDELPEDMIHNPNDIPEMPAGYDGKKGEDDYSKEGPPGSQPPKEKPKGDKPGRH